MITYLLGMREEGGGGRSGGEGRVVVEGAAKRDWPRGVVGLRSLREMRGSGGASY